MNLTPMDYVRAALANALAEGLTLEDVWAAAEHAKGTREFDQAVNELVNMTPTEGGSVWCNDRWAAIR